LRNYGSNQNVFNTLKASISQNYLSSANAMKSPNQTSINKGNFSVVPWQYNTAHNLDNFSQEDMKTTDRKYDLYLKIQHKKKMERENEEYIRRLEDGLVSEYKYYRNCKDGKGFSAENVMQEATNKALDKIKKLQVL